MTVKHSQNVAADEVKDGVGVTRKMLISPEEAPNFAMRLFSIQPDGSMPNHTNQVEHEQYVVGGTARICIGEEIYEVQKGDVVFIPADVPHWYTNIGSEPFEFLCMVPNKPDSPKVLG